MSDIDSFKEKLQSLITKFEKDKTHYLSKGYPEAQVRIYKKIDKIVYGLYGITKEERKIIVYDS
ncbi:MAG: hypothetical protein NT055_04430 [Nitrospirae bacterium]|nr:hypothetical protein [Nitrospirota bacterium]